MQRPIIYEINTWWWLEELGAQYGREVQLGTVPSEVWDDIAAWGMDAVWLMGVWRRSERGRTLLEREPAVRRTMESLFPHEEEQRIIPSPYCVQAYEVEEKLGGWVGLKSARAALAERGIGLILDFVPNHTAPDHPWVDSHPEFYVAGKEEDAWQRPNMVIDCGGRLIARGRDPFFPPWPDVIQLNAFHEGYRKAAIAELGKIASCCDGVRCDMAMLMLTEIFAQTWQGWVAEHPRREYWDEVISGVRERYPQFIFLAEVYWGHERTLMELGFDYGYDKTLYDLLLNRDIAAIRRHLSHAVDYQDRLCRFLENHDEERVARIFPAEQLKAAAIASFTIPGARLLHDGQLEGRKISVPVYAPSRPMETRDLALEGFWHWLIAQIRTPIVKEGAWQLMPPFRVWPDNVSGGRLIAWLWTYEVERLLVIVNYAAQPSQGLLPLPLSEEQYGKDLSLTDLATGIIYPRVTHELRTWGLYVDLPPWGYHAFRFWARTS